MGYIKWLGHAAFEVELDGLRLYFDPWIENPKSPVKVSDISKADFIFVTHDHGDHLGNAVEIAEKTGAKIVAIFDLCQAIKEEGAEVECIDMNIGGLSDIGGVSVALVPALHSSAHGSPVGFVVKGKEATIYHAGDTGIFMDMQLIGELYKPDIAMLPIGGWYTMGPYEAAHAVKLIKPKVVIPMHYGTFPAIKGSPEEFIKYVQRIYPVQVIVLEPGQKFEF